MISGTGSAPPLLGRDAELSELSAIVDLARAGAGAIAVVEGVAGVGKTRLLDEIVVRGRRDGVTCLRTACEEGTVRPFGALLDALAAADREASVGFSPESEPGSDPSEYRLVEEIVDSLESLSATAPLLLAVDDLHWADPSTLVTLRRAARRLAIGPVAILVAVRSEHPARVARTVDDLLRLGALHVRLGALSEPDAEHLVQEIAGAEPGPRLIGLMRRAAGNPLYLVELTRSLMDEGALAISAGMADIAGESLPAPFRATVVRRLRSLPPTVLDAIRAGAILGQWFELAELAGMLGRSALETTRAVEAAIRAGIIQDAGDRLAFVHTLVRQAVYEDLSPVVRRRLHRETADALVAFGAPPDRVARHMILGADRGERSVVRWLRDAAARTAQQAPGTACDLLERAREIVSPTDPDRDGLLADLAMAWATTGRLRDAEALARDVLRRYPGPAIAGRLRAGIVYALTWQGRPADAVVASDAVEPSLSPAQRLLLQAEGSVAQILTGDAASAGPRIQATLEAARRSGHTLSLCHSLCAATRERMLTGHFSEALSFGTEAVRLAEADPSLAPAQPWFFLGLALTVADRTDEAEAVLRRGREVAEGLGLTWALPLSMSYIANVDWLAGRWENALAEDEAGWAITEEFGMRLSVILASASRRARIAVHRGKLDVAEGAVGEAETWLAEAGRQGGDVLVLSARDLLLEARGDLRGAADVFAWAWRQNLEMDVVSEMRLLGPDLVRLSLATGREGFASSLLPDVERMASKMGVPSAEGAALRCRGLVAGDPDALVQAAAAYRRSPRVVELAQTCADAAMHLARAGRKKPAAAMLEESEAIFARLEASRDLRRLREVALRHGLAGPPPAVRPSTGWESLTASERRIAELVGEGATNRAVAETLFISTHTVDSHLRHVFAKLGISPRVQLARIVATQTSRRETEERRR